jgi:hypothetical protein
MITGNDPQKKGDFTRKMIHSNFKNIEGPQLNYNKLPSIIIKVKVKVNLEQATKAQRGSTGIALLFP